MLELYKLGVFAQVAEVGSFSAAAERLFMTQPAISQHMQELEASLGVKLFLRGRRGVTLTQEGKTLHAYATRILNLVAETEQAVAQVSQLTTGQIALGATPGVGMYVLPGWIQLFHEKYAGVSVTSQSGVTAEIAARVLDNSIDLGFVEGEPEQAASARLETKVICTVPQLFVMGPKHAWWARPTVDFSELNGQAFVTRQRGSHSRLWMNAVFADHDARPRIVAEFDNPEVIKRAVMSQAVIALLPAYAVQEELERGVLRALDTGVKLTRDLRAIWHAGRLPSPLARAFILLADHCVLANEPSG